MTKKQQEQFILMPRELTAENGAKELLLGEFYETIEDECPECYGEGCEECDQRGYHNRDVFVSWDTIKAIYRMAAANLWKPER